MVDEQELFGRPHALGCYSPQGRSFDSSGNVLGIAEIANTSADCVRTFDMCAARLAGYEDQATGGRGCA